MESCPSMLDVVKNGLQASGRTTYLHRVLYVGEHQLGKDLEDFYRNIITSHVDQPREEALTGFLLVYPHHFIHLVEGSESTLTRHFRSVVNPDLSEANQIGAVKILIEIAHINKRCLAMWSSRTATPPTLATHLKAGVSETVRHMNSVLTKTLRLVDALKKQPPGAPLTQQIMLQLPEAELLQFLLASPLIKDVRVILGEHRAPPRITLYDDVVWPMQSDFVPYNLLEEPIAVQSSARLENVSQEKDEENGGEEGDKSGEVEGPENGQEQA